MLLEVGMGQAQDVMGLVKAAIACSETQILADLNGIDRVVIARRAL